ncbi:hypothetical protein IKG41_01330 [Candidatus Saccharibacteria bacterium]|nr:hypothetical protein [Candidatus Saccharibacteria bacterium]
MKKYLLPVAVLIAMFISLPALAISETQKNSIIDNCASIKQTLEGIQKTDARARVYLGSYYETILTKFITPLNVRLVENNLSTAELVENQNNFASAKTVFTNDYISYQQNLEELVAIDCKTEPESFYDKLIKVRQKRKIMEQDVLKLRSFLSEHIKLVDGIKGKL